MKPIASLEDGEVPVTDHAKQQNLDIDPAVAGYPAPSYGKIASDMAVPSPGIADDNNGVRGGPAQPVAAPSKQQRLFDDGDAGTAASDDEFDPGSEHLPKGQRKTAPICIVPPSSKAPRSAATGRVPRAPLPPAKIFDTGDVHQPEEGFKVPPVRPWTSIGLLNHPSARSSQEEEEEEEEEDYGDELQTQFVRAPILLTRPRGSEANDILTGGLPERLAG